MAGSGLWTRRGGAPPQIPVVKTSMPRLRASVAFSGILAWTALGAVPAGATGSMTADHWGEYFGGPKVTHDEERSPTPIALPGPIAQVATSNSTQYALLRNGMVYAWGLGDQGQLGDGGTADSFTVAVKVDFPPGVKIASLPTDSMPYDTAMAIDTTGHAWGWGDDSAGQLCEGNTKTERRPVEVPLTDVTIAAGAGDHALYDSDGTLYACGRNSDGDLGNGNTTPSFTPVKVSALAGEKIGALVASYHDSGALLRNGQYFDWGYDGLGQLGDGLIGVDSYVPVLVTLPLPVTQVVQGGSISANGQTLVMLSNGSMRSWGDDQNGQLGDQKTMTEPSPIQFHPLRGVTYRLLAAGGNTSYAVSRSGAVYSWGGSKSGQIGNGGTSVELVPVKVETGVSRISSTANNVATS